MMTHLLLKGELTPKARILAALAGVAMLAAIFLPLWQMTMISNQYPEGLRMWIYTYKLTGDLQEINTLNHYIGMHPLDSEHFAELRILPFSFGLGALLCLLAALVHRRFVTTLVLAGGFVSGLVSMAIMFYELYNYGHNLDPKAAIDVPPFMPPPLGFNKIANFHVTSFFHLGSLFFIVAIVALVIALWISRPPIAGRKPQITGPQIHATR